VGLAELPQTALIVGVDGQIGGALAGHLHKEGWTVCGTSRHQTEGTRIVHLDLAKVDDCAGLPPADVAFLCAAETKMARCRTSPEETAKINVDGLVAVAARLSASGVFVVFLSSHAIFDGRVAYRRADETVCPQTVYGEQKALAEKRLLALGNRVAIVRLSKVLTSMMPLISGWIHSLRQGDQIRPFSDMVVAPLPMVLVTEVLAKIAGARCPGIFQLSGSRDVSYADIALHIARPLGVSEALICPITASEAGIPSSEVFLHTAMDCSKLEKAFGIVPPDPKEVIDQALALETRVEDLPTHR
jgi:dTDP-4-dehydrorhamnose reductase